MPATKKRTVRKTPQTKTLVVSEIQLAPNQVQVITMPTPPELIKSKPGRGGRRVSYIEGGYVISKLNAAFSPIGWEFDIVEQGESNRKTETRSEGEVWVKGMLTIIDHKNGFRVSKTQYGQHPIHQNVPIGDAFKAAGTDALKKCASLLGIALDVYWNQDDQPNKQTKGAKGDQKLPAAEMFERAKVMIEATRDVGVLIEYDEKLKDSKTYNETQKKELHEIVTKRVEKLDAKN